MANYEIQPITLSDLKILQAISRETFKETFDPFTAPDDMAEFLRDNYADDKLSRELQNPDSQFFFLSVDSKIAGYLKVNQGEAQTEEMDDDHFELERIYIRKAFQHQGLGSVLMDYALKLAKEAGKQFIWLGVYEKNIRAQKFYAKNGFKRFGQHVYQVGDDPQIDYLLKKKL